MSGDELRLVHFAEADEVGVVEVVGIGTHVEVFFAVFDVFLADVRSEGYVVFWWILKFFPEFIGESGPVLFLAHLIEVEQIITAGSLVAG